MFVIARLVRMPVFLLIGWLWGGGGGGGGGWAGNFTCKKKIAGGGTEKEPYRHLVLTWALTMSVTKISN